MCNDGTALSPLASPRMYGTGGRRFAYLLLSLIGGLAFLSATLGCSRDIVLLDPALPLVDPDGARSYRSFRLGPARSEVLEYPSADAQEFLKTLARRPPRAVLLSPLLASEYPAVRNALPDAWILGWGLPEDARTISAAWDPAPSAREAGRRAGDFLAAAGNPAGVREAVIVSARSVSGAETARAAFLEGLLSRAPGVNRTTTALPANAGSDDAAALARDLSGPGRRAVFFDSGSAGLTAARALDKLRTNSPGLSGEPGILVVVRLANRTAPADAPGDFFLSGDTEALLAALKAAWKYKQAAHLRVPESFFDRFGAKFR